MNAIRNRIALIGAGNDRGEGAFSYMAVLLLIAAIVAVLFTANIGNDIKKGMTCAVNKVLADAKVAKASDECKNA
ncbi:hypothetical protein [Spirillospora sp. NPDC029432]|uniref:hypothetical protein n=1 Tax=Spirillospora sp. NPDC029432 TaxID=3154599 RepID=UPI0034530C55